MTERTSWAVGAVLGLAALAGASQLLAGPFGSAMADAAAVVEVAVMPAPSWTAARSPPPARWGRGRLLPPVSGRALTFRAADRRVTNTQTGSTGISSAVLSPGRLPAPGWRR